MKKNKLQHPGRGRAEAEAAALTWRQMFGAAARICLRRSHGSSLRNRYATSKVAPPHICFGATRQ